MRKKVNGQTPRFNSKLGRLYTHSRMSTIHNLDQHRQDQQISLLAELGSSVWNSCIPGGTLFGVGHTAETSGHWSSNSRRRRRN